MTEQNFTSLMDLATADTSEIKGIRNRLTDAGIYIVDFVEVTLKATEEAEAVMAIPAAQRTEEDQKQLRANLRFEGLIVDFDPHEPEAFTPEQVEAKRGAAFNQFETMWLEDPSEAIALVKGRYYERARFPTNGPLGGLEDTTGWLNGIEGKRVGIRIRHAKGKDGNPVAWTDWLSPKELKAVGYDWEEMQREALNPDGTPIDEDELYKRN